MSQHRACTKTKIAYERNLLTITSIAQTMLHSVRQTARYQSFKSLTYPDHRGNAVLIGFTIMNMCIFGFSKVYYILRRRYRERAWNALTLEVGAGMFLTGCKLAEHIRSKKSICEPRRMRVTSGKISSTLSTNKQRRSRPQVWVVH
jgi:hypothetical protein